MGQTGCYSLFFSGWAGVVAEFQEEEGSNNKKKPSPPLERVLGKWRNGVSQWTLNMSSSLVCVPTNIGFVATAKHIKSSYRLNCSPLRGWQPCHIWKVHIERAVGPVSPPKRWTSSSMEKSLLNEPPGTRCNLRNCLELHKGTSAIPLCQQLLAVAQRPMEREEINKEQLLLRGTRERGRAT